MARIILSGCTPVPLAHYLKALGILRVVSMQRAESVLGFWSQNHFILETNMTHQELISFFQMEYVPTPLVVPWSGNDFFAVNVPHQKVIYPNTPTASRVIEAIIATDTERFANYRDILHSTLSAMRECNVLAKKAIEGSGTQQRALKASLLQTLRNKLSDEAVAWIDAASVIEPSAPYFNALLGGGGGSDGNSHFSDNYMQSLWMALSDFDNQRAKPVSAVGGIPFNSSAALTESLFAIWAPGTRIPQLSPVLFDSTAVGGPNQTCGFEADAGSNPWDFIFMLEGALLFAGALGRKMNGNHAPSARFPFLLNSSSVGLGSSYFGESSGREVWLPIWSAPSNLQEISFVFAEGRIEKHGKMARNGVDAFVALAQHGHSTGISAFQRIGFFKGRIGGDNYYTAVDQGRFHSFKNSRIDLLKDIDGWLDVLQSAAHSECPRSIQAGLVQIEKQIAELSLSQSGDSCLDLLISLGRTECLLANNLKWSVEKYIHPLFGLRSSWLEAMKNDKIEFRLAASLAGMRATLGGSRGLFWFRQHLEPVEIGTSKDRSWANWAAQASNDVVWHDGHLTDALNDILARRLIRFEQAGAKGCPEVSPRPASLKDVTDFIEGRTNDALLADLIWGLSLVNWQSEELWPAAPVSQPEIEYDWTKHDFHKIVPSSFYALLKLCFQPPRREAVIPLDPTIFNRARFGQGEQAAQLAVRRLRASGKAPLVSELPVAGDVARRTAAALIFPIRPADLSLLEKIIIKQPEGVKA